MLYFIAIYKIIRKLWGKLSQTTYTVTIMQLLWVKGNTVLHRKWLNLLPKDVGLLCMHGLLLTHHSFFFSVFILQLYQDCSAHRSQWLSAMTALCCFLLLLGLKPGGRRWQPIQDHRGELITLPWTFICFYNGPRILLDSCHLLKKHEEKVISGVCTEWTEQSWYGWGNDVWRAGNVTRGMGGNLFF